MCFRRPKNNINAILNAYLINILLTVNRSAKCERGSKKRAAMNEFHEGTKQIRNTNQAKRESEKERAQKVQENCNRVYKNSATKLKKATSKNS